MWKSLVTCLNGVIDDEIVEVRKPKDRNRMYRDDEPKEKDLSTAYNHAKNTKPISISLSRDQKESPERCGGRDDAKRSDSSSIGEKGVVRVKIVLTKQEAAQLMSKCKGQEGVLKDVLRELKRIEISRVSLSVSALPTTSCPNSWRPALTSIPEDR